MHRGISLRFQVPAHHVHPANKRRREPVAISYDFENFASIRGFFFADWLLDGSVLSLSSCVSGILYIDETMILRYERWELI